MINNKYVTSLLIGALLLLQLWIVYTQQLFGDEAFYWLESQHLDWSYSELPGWTAWMIRLGTSVFGHNYFAVRIVSYAGFISIFWAMWLINRHFLQVKNLYLIFTAIPILMLLAVMALPDIWLVVFVMWISYFLIKAVAENRLLYWIVTGILLALSINVHVRMWIWLFIAGLIFIVYFHAQKDILKPALFLCLPIGLLGMVPILIFNFQHDFVMFSFQLSSRHPWQFQIENISFLLSQFIVITPIVLYLWLSNCSKTRQYSDKQPIISWLLLTAFIHWILYIFLSLFADGFRTTVHWVLISYVPVLAISGLLEANQKLLKWSISTGIIGTLTLLLFFAFNRHHSSNLEARVFDNSQGWHELSVKVSDLQKQHNIDHLITDYFMTASELAFELKIPHSIKVLSHPKNIKHGRQQQLLVMGMLLDNPQSYEHKALLVVEDSTLKLQDKGRYYSQLCHDFKQVDYLDTLNIANSQKQFHIFKIDNTQNKTCEIPPIFYIQHKEAAGNIKISGWVVFHQVGIRSLSIISNNDVMDINVMNLENSGIKNLFPEINDPNQPNNGFEITLPASGIINHQFRIRGVGNDGEKYLSKIYYLD